MSVTPMPGAEPVDLTEPKWAEFTKDKNEQSDAANGWRVAVQDMSAASTLSAANGPALLRYAMAVALHGRASRAVFAAPASKPKDGKEVAAWDMNVSLMKQASAMCSALEAELGLSPRRRGAVSPAKKKTTTARAADAYLAPRAV